MQHEIHLLYFKQAINRRHIVFILTFVKVGGTKTTKGSEKSLRFEKSYNVPALMLLEQFAHTCFDRWNNFLTGNGCATQWQVIYHRQEFQSITHLTPNILIRRH